MGKRKTRASRTETSVVLKSEGHLEVVKYLIGRTETSVVLKFRGKRTRR